MTDLEYGTFAVDADARRVRGILVPWGEKSRTSTSKTKPITFPHGAVATPRDPAVVGLNVNHDRFSPIGRADVLETKAEGLYAEFVIADTEEGDAWLNDHGQFVKLSAEVRDIERDANDFGTARLTGASLVTEGAFASAALFAIDGDPDEEPDEEEETTEPAPAETEEEPDEEPDEPEGDAVAEATAKEVMLAGRGKSAEPALTRSGMFAVLDRIKQGQASERDYTLARAGFQREEVGGLFALTDIKYDALPSDIGSILPPQWIGEVTDGTSYSQTFVSLFGSASLTSLSMAGWRWLVKPTGGAWAGNKQPITSTPATFGPVSEDAVRWAGGNDIAREHRDFGTPGFFEAYDRAMRESFSKWLDEDVVAAGALTAATPLEADDPAGLTIGAGWSQLIDGALAVTEAGLTPTGAVISNTLAKGMLKFPQSDILGYLSGALNLEGGSLDGFQFKFSSLVPADHILVTARTAADVYTLPGSPIRAEALRIDLGGIDIGYYGYGGFFVNNPAGIVDVAPFTAAARSSKKD
jgi:hypothetical protein